MIPKKIHYVLIGDKKISKEDKKCISTWKRKFKDFEIVEWNEKNINMTEDTYIKNAYENKQWKQLNEYIKLYVLYKEGGIYLDTDMFALESIEDYLDNKVFVSFENSQYISTAIIGAQQNHRFVKEVMDYYSKLNVIDADLLDYNEILTNLLKEEYNCYLNNNEQVLKDEIHVYQDSIFCTPSLKSKMIHLINKALILKEKKNWKIKLDRKIRMRLKNRKRIEAYLKIKKIISRIMP